MSMSHLIILGLFILVGGAGLAAVQRSLADCFRHGYSKREPGGRLATNRQHAYRA
jgi:hypothetical protein